MDRIQGRRKNKGANRSTKGISMKTPNPIGWKSSYWPEPKGGGKPIKRVSLEEIRKLIRKERIKADIDRD